MSTVVRVIIVNREHKLLLQRTLDGTYTLIGDKTKDNENPEQALVRAVKEQLNYDLFFFTKLNSYKDAHGEEHIWYLAYLNTDLQLKQDYELYTYDEASRLPLTISTQDTLYSMFGPIDYSFSFDNYGPPEPAFDGT
jgi:ADP-ribose pyrophosphatase YjhB (NUDIX family)